jgi:alpha/beta superfamily hydrolase
MPGRTLRELIAGPAGRLEVAVDSADSGSGAPSGLALIAHPHPLYGGSLDNKVAYTLARALVELGCVSLRPNFRGVGESEGRHDEGRGEVDDLAATLAWGEQRFGRLPLTLAGYSFGAAMQTHLAERLRSAGIPPARVILVGPAVSGGRAHPSVPRGTLVIHGEKDETIPLAAVLDWARPQDLPVVVIPGADHFFHSRLTPIRELVLSHRPAPQ